MSDFPLWGTPAGTLAYEDNQRRDLLTAANFRHLSSESDVLDSQVQNERAMGELMRQGMGPQGAAPAGTDAGALGATASAPTLGDRFGRLAELAARAGLVKQADAFGKTSSLMQAREASVRARNARALESHLGAVKKEAELVGQLMGDVKDEDSWNLANAMFAFQTGQESPYSNLSYDPAIVERIKSGAITAAKKVDESIAQQRVTDRKAFEDASIKQQDTQNGIRQAAQATREAREARLAKNGGSTKPIVVPKAMTEQARKMILKDYPEMKDAVGDAPEAIASEAARLMRLNAALDPSTALGQAFAASVKAGDFQTEAGYGGTNLGKKTSFTSQGRTAESAMKLPANKDRLVKNRFYTNDKGQVGQWDGTKFKLGVSAPALSSNNAPVIPDDSEDDEEADD